MKGKLIQDKYRILKILGRNAFSETLLATDNSRFYSRRRYIIKRFRPILGNPEAENIRRLSYQEARVLKRLSGKNRQIPRLYEYFMDGEDFYLVREWIAGLTLKQRVEQKGPLSTEEVEQILNSVLSFLKYIHSYGIIYRQLKPSTIILRQDYWLPASLQNCLPVPIYFGGVKDLENQVDNHQQYNLAVPYRRDYISPEQKQGKSVFASDLYSLGLTAIYLLTGKHPGEFSLDPRSKKLRWHQEIPKQKIHLVRVIERAICPEMSDRYISAEKMLQALNSVPVNLAMPIIEPVPKQIKFPSEFKVISLLSGTTLGVLALILVIFNSDLTQFAKRDGEQYLKRDSANIVTDTLTTSSVFALKQPPTTINIPAFPLGMTEQKIAELLGEPTKNSSGYWSNSRALLYQDVVPRQISLGYLTDTDSTKVRQAEIAFSRSVDLKTIKQQVKQLMQDNYSPEIEHHLEQVYFKTISGYEFQVNNIEGVVQQNPENHIYFAIWDREFH
ncbi:MAG: serine/threonine protein kinase [Hyellaceae cyanobacterium CSU_1_1]|nr:serine/threonine protein kinase [Pleurocapsa sp. CRU_1_2]NJR47733.1 serine/threonine protein kinase [Hyellaceae cyanobacterium CSU_1_1]